MTNKKDKKEQIWTALFLVTPLVILTRLSELIGDNATSGILFSGIFGGLGGLLGWTFYYFVKTKTTLTKIITLTVLIGLCITTIFITSTLTKPKPTTCEICGYLTLKPIDKECAYCGNVTWDEEKRMTSFSTKDEWIKDGQLFWFRIDSLNQKINFFNPTIDEGFEKDKNWKPLLTEEEIREDLKSDK
jgi:hypothetical protein